MVTSNWAKNPGPGRVLFSALPLLFLCLVPTLLFAQASPSDIGEAAAAGDAQAQFALGNYYFRARYVTLEYAQALSWTRKSAAQGFAPAQNQLGSMYENRIGVPQDYKRAATYYRLAANQGYALAQSNLAVYSRPATASIVTISRPSPGTAKRPTRISPLPRGKSATSTSADLGSSAIMPRLWPGIAAPPATATPTPKTS